MRSFEKLLLLSFLVLLPAAAQPYTFNFGTPVVLAPTDTPGAWYPDRFPPHGFVSPVTAPNGTMNTLQESIAASDLQPGVSFYNTQGRVYDMPPNTTSVSIWLYVPAAWATQPTRDAGFWTVVDGGNDYPIIEFQGPITTPVANGPSYYPNVGAGFYGWNNVTSTFQFIGLPAGFTYNSFVQLTITFVPPSGGFIYTVGSGVGAVSQVSPQSTTVDHAITNVILEGYNYGANYSIYWWDPPTTTADSYQVNIATDLNVGDSFINLTNSGVSGASLSAGTTATIAGSICVNAYAFAADEQMVACCSCPVTPNGSSTISVRNDLLANVLEPQLTNNAVSINLTATAPAGGSCTGSAFGSGAPVAGLAAWETTLHADTAVTPSVYQETASTFAVKPLTSAESTRLTTLCGFIVGNGSGAGVCPSCAVGALAASKQ